MKRKTRPTDAGLSASDRGLIYMVVNVCIKLGWFDLIDDVFAQPSAARAALHRILAELLYPGEATDYGHTPAQHHEIAARLHRWAERQDLDSSIADAFLLEKAEWTALHVGRSEP